MGGERNVMPLGLSEVGGRWRMDSMAKNEPSAWDPLAMERMCSRPCGEGANYTMQLLVRAAFSRRIFVSLRGVLL